MLFLPITPVGGAVVPRKKKKIPPLLVPSTLNQCSLDIKNRIIYIKIQNVDKIKQTPTETKNSSISDGSVDFDCSIDFPDEHVGCIEANGAC